MNPSLTEHALIRERSGAVQAAVRRCPEDDTTYGRLRHDRQYCDACERVRPAPGFIQDNRYGICTACWTEYERARTAGLVNTPGQYVRAKRFGDIGE